MEMDKTMYGRRELEFELRIENVASKLNVDVGKSMPL